jgi:L-rhamnose-H+ transport protein
MEVNPSAAANPALGVMLHAIGGLAAASFYIPYKRVRGWSWETYWLAGGFFSWIIAPWMIALIFVPDTVTILREAPSASLLWTYFFGVLWGIGGLMFGLTMRYLGISLGYAVALGFCAAFGTLVPPLYNGCFGDAEGKRQLTLLLTTHGGLTVILGVVVCLVGIAVSGLAGIAKERELTDEQKKATVREFSFARGMVVAVICGILSASMAFAFASGAPIAAGAVRHGADALRNLPLLIVAFAGGFTTNFIWCVILNVRNKSAGQYLGGSTNGESSPLLWNYLFCALAGGTWYLQFFFYGMGTTKMGQHDFSSWTLHMASIIAFSTLWGIALKEWKGTCARTKRLIAVGLALLVFSTIVVGYGNKFSSDAKKAEEATKAAKESR